MNNPNEQRSSPPSETVDKAYAVVAAGHYRKTLRYAQANAGKVMYDRVILEDMRELEKQQQGERDV